MIGQSVIATPPSHKKAQLHSEDTHKGMVEWRWMWGGVLCGLPFLYFFSQASRSVNP
ncbi:hypothetical protein BU24DRAFT_428920 [Aaosphaeria arxii CBS 175.79]|uniref:Uncharacterized protein n=1 Tax=Aaosphaeria arxii CBS 175.79 TaxID=1450172 RepID=A0A6A5X7R0_9PLEO|nr:uncharacterized protein BU24DRAFT_428920 [Aaosphaeria arxii CBS 175.79]KAF2008936.1 hypothetical protein BU24DRAFT_428920 [Aaosphaeria arxii CBS 175.79]